MDPLGYIRSQGTVGTVALPNDRAPKKVMTFLSAGKVMANIFCDLQAVIYYPQKHKALTELYYAELVGRFDVELQKKPSHLAKKKVFSHPAPSILVELGYKQLPYPLYFLDLAPCEILVQ